MNTRQLWLLALTLVLVGGFTTPAMATEKAPGGKDEAVKAKARVCVFIDEDGDGFNDLAPDDDGDGIPNRLDPDFEAGKEHGEQPKGWFRFARLFRLLLDDRGMKGALGTGGSGPGSLDDTGLGEGPGPRTGFGPGSGDQSDDSGVGGRSHRRGGQR